MNEDDPLTILMAFSGDPVGTLQSIVALVEKVKMDITEVDKQIENRKLRLGEIGDDSTVSERYKEELVIVDSDIALLGELR